MKRLIAPLAFAALVFAMLAAAHMPQELATSIAAVEYGK